jgi:hypothetical protein
VILTVRLVTDSKFPRESEVLLGWRALSSLMPVNRMRSRQTQTCGYSCLELNISKIISLEIILLILAHIFSFLICTSATLVSTCTFLRHSSRGRLESGRGLEDPRLESRIYKKDIKKEFPKIERQSFKMR